MLLTLLTENNDVSLCDAILFHNGSYHFSKTIKAELLRQYKQFSEAISNEKMNERAMINTSNVFTNNRSSNSGAINLIGKPVFEVWPWQVLLIIGYGVTTIMSLVMNIITIVVFCIHRNRLIPGGLWKYLINLAIADIFMASFCIPSTFTNAMLHRWIFFNFACSVSFFIQSLSVFVSVWTLTIIGIDRYYAIMRPLHRSYLRNHKNRVICLIWLMGMALASVTWWVSKAEDYTSRDGTITLCGENWPNEWSSKMYTLSVFSITFAVPMATLLHVYTGIQMEIRDHVLPGNPNASRDNLQAERRDKMLRIYILVVASFFVFWSPLQFFNMVVEYWEDATRPRSHLAAASFYACYFIFHFLAMLHSAINPIVYCYNSYKFRKCVYSIFANYVCVRIAEEDPGQTMTTLNSKIPKRQTKITGIQVEDFEQHHYKHHSHHQQDQQKNDKNGAAKNITNSKCDETTTVP